MKKIVILSMVFAALTTSAGFAQEVKIKDDKVKIEDDKVKIKDDKVKIKTKDDKMKVSTGNYKALYSSDFQMGNASHVQKIMDVWQDWDDNMLDRHDYFSDTVTMYFSDGNWMKGKAENLAAAKQYRGGYTSVKSDLHAVVPLWSNDRNEDAVAIWGMETNTLPDGKVERRSIHEVWFFNKDGQIATMRQWQANVKP